MFFLTEGKLETRVETSHVSRGLLQSAPLALSDPSPAPRTMPMAHGDNIASKYKTKTRKQQTKRKDSNNKGKKDNKTFIKHDIVE